MFFKKQPFKREYICPYCFNDHALYDVKFRCDNQDCDLEEDPIYEKFSGGYNSEMPRVIPASHPTGAVSKLLGKMPTEIECDKCEEQTTIKICSSCHSELPSTIGDFEDLIFAVVGAKETGKSNFVSVLIDQLSREVGGAYNCVLEPLNDDTIGRYRRDFWTPLFREKRVVDVTHEAQRGDDVTRPLLYTLKFFKKGGSQKTKIDKVITLAFFDTAGEDLDSEDTMSRVNKYIYNSSGIILLLDPLQLDYVRDQFPDSYDKPDINTDGNEILFRMTNLIRKATKLKHDKKVDIPLAVTFSKIDAVKSILDPSSPLHFPSQHIQKRAFDLTDFQNVQSEIEGLIKDWSETSMTNILEANYSSYGYFGISSLGHNPEAGVIQEINPYRVTDPFLWLLAEHKVIQTNKKS